VNEAENGFAISTGSEGVITGLGRSAKTATTPPSKVAIASMETNSKFCFLVLFAIYNYLYYLPCFNIIVDIAIG
jgi:hypothetical protein